MVIVLPQVGHWPSCAAIDSLASRRDEQYAQLKPYRLPVREEPVISDPNCGRGGAAPRPSEPAPAPTSCALRSSFGTRSVDMQVGQRTSSPACDSSAVS